MQYRVKLKARVVEGATKEQLMTQVFSGFEFGYILTWNGYISGYMDGGRTFREQRVRLVNFEKQSRKVKILPNGERQIVRRGKWVAYYYDVPVNMIQEAKQNARNFHLKLRTY